MPVSTSDLEGRSSSRGKKVSFSYLRNENRKTLYSAPEKIINLDLRAYGQQFFKLQIIGVAVSNKKHRRKLFEIEAFYLTCYEVVALLFTVDLVCEFSTKR